MLHTRFGKAPAPWRRLGALVLAIALLTACGGSASSTPAQAEAAPAPADDTGYVMPRPEGEGTLAVNGGGAPIALALDYAGEADGRNAAVLRGVQAFAGTFNFTVQTYAAADNTAEAAAEALTEASQCGASLVVCVGETMAVALHAAQDTYPTVGYLLLDAEPHSADYSSYSAAPNTHSVLFHEEEAAYLAGYAAVMDGYTQLGFLGGVAMPDIVRYCTGFIQGAEAAAALQGQPVTVKTWYSGLEQANEDLTARMSGWYTDGTQIILVAGGDLVQSCIAATQTAGTGSVIGAGCDQGSQGAAVLTSAANRYSAVTQQQLYVFFSGGAAWDASAAGQTARLGVQQDAVALPTTDWRFASFDAAAYSELYQALRSGAVSVESYADSGDLPPTVNVTVEPQN